jgi:hypothetical protein
MAGAMTWYHCTGSMYGNWLPGDRRGWRSRNHRIHVPGDYIHPPDPRLFARTHRRSRTLLQSKPMWLDPAQRRIICLAWDEALRHYSLGRGEIAIGSRHWHLLIGCLDQAPKHWVGKLKSWSLKRLAWAGSQPDDPLWAQGCRAEPVRGEKHFHNTAAYIARHHRQGAAVWSMVEIDPSQ